MSIASMALIIVALILAQVAGFVFVGLKRRRDAHRAAGAQAPASGASEGSAGLPAGWSGFRGFEVTRKVQESADGNIVSFYLSPTDGAALPGFEPGQFLTLQLETQDGADGTPETLIRCYSLSDAPGRNTYRITVKRVPAPQGRSDLPPGRASNWLHDRIEPGDRIAVRAPSGEFYLQQASALPVVLIGGGIGITPMLSILHHLVETGSQREIRLFYGVRNGREAVMLKPLRQLAAEHPNVHLHPCFSAPLDADRADSEDWHEGRVDIALLRNTLPLCRHQFYVCGPGPMMESLVPALEDWSRTPEDIFFEAFGPASLKRPKKSLPPDAGREGPLVTFGRAGTAIPWDPASDSLLEWAEANDIEVNSGCRSGVCGGCQRPLLEGEVEYTHPPTADLEPGHCLLCISRPKTAITLG